MIAKLNIMIKGDGVYFVDLNNTNRTTLVHCMNRTLFEAMLERWGADNRYLMRAVREAENSFHTVTMPAERLYEVVMQSDPETEGYKDARVSLCVNGIHPHNTGLMSFKFDIQWSAREHRIIAKSMHDSAHHIAWYSYENALRVPDSVIDDMVKGNKVSTIDSEIFQGMDSPNFLDLFEREPILLAAFAGFEANMRVRCGLSSPQPVAASRYLTDRPLKDIKGILTELGMNETDAITFAQNLGYAGLSTGSEFHNSLVRDIRGMLINKLK